MIGALILGFAGGASGRLALPIAGFALRRVGMSPERKRLPGS